MRIWERMKTKKGLLILVTVALMLAASVALAASYPFTGVTNDSTNMRSSASSSVQNIICRIPDGETVTVIGASGNFYRIQYDGKTGYVFKQYVEEGSGSTSGESGSAGLTTTGYPYNTVATSSVNLRASTSTSAKKLTTVPRGATITVHKVSGSWANVTYSGKTGWVMKQYIQLATIASPTAVPTPSATMNPVEDSSSYQLLQSGADGNHVTALQEALIELGFLRGSADGQYGSATAQAVMAFQRVNDLPITGYADANLQALIFNGKPLNASGVKTKVATLPAIEGLNVSSGDKGVIVRTIQTRLAEKGYYTGTVSGTYDSKTVSAVKAFQKKNGLKQDGVCGESTQALLFGSGLSANAEPTATPVPTATPLPEMEKPGKTVRSGSSGADALLVQNRLIELGYLSGKADGKFGSKSVAALKAFQKMNGLTADGVAGSGTYEVLFSYVALAADYQPIATVVPTAPAATPTPAAITKDNVVLIKQGVSGDAVLRLQKRLQELGYYTSAQDARCKADDVAAIRAFQKQNSLTVDGVAGYDTQVLLYSNNAIMYDGNYAGSLTASYETLKKGMRGEAVKAMQERLIALGYLTGTADGIFGTDTAEAVYHFQKQNGLVRDSVAGEKTLKLLFSASAAGKPAVTVKPTVTNPPTATITTALMRLGDSNDSVKAMQQKLISLGYLSGAADGIFGNLTFRALKEFQKANALSADGVAGSQTITALNKVTLPSATPGTTGGSTGSSSGSSSTVTLSAENVRYEYWYATVRNECRKYPYCTLYDPATGISWQVHMFSYGKHAEIEPLTANDTEKMYQACGYQSWTPRPVWVIFADGTIRIATTHSVPHEVQHITDNNFAGHSCLHFPRTMAQVTAIGPYATKHQAAVDKAWAELQTQIK